MSKRLWILVKGTIPKPSPGDPNFLDWQSNAYAAAGLILLSLEESQHTHVAGLEEDPVLMWKTLEDVHIQKRPNSRFLAYSNLLSIVKQPEESLPALTTRIEQAIKDVKALRPTGYTLDKLDDDLSCMAMLRSLPPDYSSFVSTISLMDTINMEKLKTAFITEEGNRKALQSHLQPSAAAHLASDPHSASFHRPPVTCTWCKHRGHVEDTCFAKMASQQRGRRRHLKPSIEPTSSSTANASQEPATATGSKEHASNTSLSPTACLTHLCVNL